MHHAGGCRSLSPVKSRTEIEPRQARRRRLGAGMAASVVTISGLLVHAVDSGPATNFVADALYAALVYLLITALAPRLRAVQVGSIAAVLCLAIELFQLTGIPAALSDSWVFRLTLGTSFALVDLVAYLVGVAAVACCDVAVTSALSRRSSGGANIPAVTTRRQPE